ncbi:MAG TPA: class I SAM-dependent methyltransferase [Mycobacteriales bacterium]|nr:class I SAM-dependent methyltransferase [Mycobacteriales bacterium]
MNWAEKALLNNPARRALHRHYEAPLLTRLGADVGGAHVLEVGCGEGAGAQTLLTRLGASRVTAIDLDPAQVKRAERRLRGEDRAEVRLGDVTALPLADVSVDAVADFGIVHHVPDWRAAVTEIARVLKPGGQFVFEEVTRHALDRATYRFLFEHPAEARFSGREFIDELERQGLVVGGRHTQRFFGDFVLGVAVRT